jgi:hypothetical protein
MKYGTPRGMGSSYSFNFISSAIMISDEKCGWYFIFGRTLVMKG